MATDHAAAAQLYKRAAECGLPEAEYNLGCCYLAGRGTEQNYVEAYRYFVSAAERGLAPAMFKAGECCENGTGTARDLGAAAKWYAAAARNGHDGATAALLG